MQKDAAYWIQQSTVKQTVEGGLLIRELTSLNFNSKNQFTNFV
jgi:hypothetical protein